MANVSFVCRCAECSINSCLVLHSGVLTSRSTRYGHRSDGRELDANALAVKPAFYNSLTTNCTTTIVKLMRAAGRTIPLDWRLIVNGYMPGFLYDNGAVDVSIPLDELEKRGRINDRAKAADNSEDFSALIRAGVPSPL